MGNFQYGDKTFKRSEIFFFKEFFLKIAIKLLTITRLGEIYQLLQSLLYSVKKKKERKKKLDKDDKVKQFEIVLSINLLINYLIKILDKVSKHLAVD